LRIYNTVQELSPITAKLHVREESGSFLWSRIR
jgi:hypothetical protein